MRIRRLIMILAALLVVMPATFAHAASAGLRGTQWRLIWIDGKAPSTGTTITIRFEANRQAVGSAGCNQYGSGYRTVTKTNRITFTGIISTMMACLQDAVMQQEMAYLDALRAATTYHISDSKLVITYGEGKTLVFVRA